MHAVIAGVTPDNTPSGYYWTFLFPMLMFIVIALVLWALFGRPHQRVPARRVARGSAGQAAAAAAAVSDGPSLTVSTEPGAEQPPSGGDGAGQ